MADSSLLTGLAILAALVVGILAGHFGWGRHWHTRAAPWRKLNPEYLAGLDFLISEQPDRALDIFLKLLDANAETVETHFALGSLYRRRGEVERAIKIHQNLLERTTLDREHREQALLALAQDYLRAGLLDRAEHFFGQVSDVPRLRAFALDALRKVYERQREWSQALDVLTQLERIDSPPPPMVAGHYLCELALQALERGDNDAARQMLRRARGAVAPFPRAALVRARIAQGAGDGDLAYRLVLHAVHESPKLLQEELHPLLSGLDESERQTLLRDLVRQAESGGFSELRRLVFAGLAANLWSSTALRPAIERVLVEDPMLREVWKSTGELHVEEIAQEIGALLRLAEKYRCSDCGFAARSFYWQCPACHAWDSFEPYAVVKLN